MKLKTFVLIVFTLFVGYFLVGCKTKNYKVTFNANGGTLISGEIEQIIKAGLSATAPVLEKEGHTLSWDVSFDNVNEELIINAVWTPNTYKVVFDGDGGTLVGGETIQYVSHGQSAVAPIFEKIGSIYTWDKDFKEVKSDLSVKAIWTDRVFTVTFNGSGGTLVSGDEIQEVLYNQAAIAPVYEMDGHTLSFDKEFDKVKSNLTVNAVWEPATLNVTFNGSGGTLMAGSELQHVRYGASATPPVYKKDGYLLTFNKDFSEITEDITIDAVWSIYLRVNKDREVNSEGEYVLFGEYPQTIKSPEVEVNESIVDGRGYFLGSDGYYYIKIRPRPYMPGYLYSDGSIATDLKDEYFKVEPLLWRITRNRDTDYILYSEMAIDTKQMHDSIQERTIEGKTIYANNYAHSDLRRWLNTLFIEIAFYPNQADIILVSTLDNSAKSTGYTSNPYFCEDTQDLVFIPSYAELVDVDRGFVEDYDLLDVNRQKFVTDYAMATKSQIHTIEPLYGYGYTWVRSPNSWEHYSFRSIYYDGRIGGRTSANNTITSLAPMVMIDISN